VVNGRRAVQSNNQADLRRMVGVCELREAVTMLGYQFGDRLDFVVLPLRRKRRIGNKLLG
jgi:hypothetical protein